MKGEKCKQKRERERETERKRMPSQQQDKPFLCSDEACLMT